MLYDGRHTKNENDGKWCSYGGYATNFYGVRRQELRVGPNLFDLMTSNNTALITATPSAPHYDDIAPPPPSYDEVVDGGGHVAGNVIDAE